MSSIDIVPTILAATGIAPEEKLPGLNLLDLARNGGKTDRTALFGEVFDHDVADIDNPAASLQYRWTLSERSLEVDSAQCHGDTGTADDSRDARTLRRVWPTRMKRTISRRNNLSAWWR